MFAEDIPLKNVLTLRRASTAGQASSGSGVEMVYLGLPGITSFDRGSDCPDVVARLASCEEVFCCGIRYSHRRQR